MWVGSGKAPRNGRGQGVRLLVVSVGLYLYEGSRWWERMKGGVACEPNGCGGW